ncbi:MAG: NAD(+) diphosphatase [Alphaproteobacteria bacterium TMED89]|nr:NAD(+) diphosphatase [Rhodospirillaceae bacterium]RPH10034.1 MAG: NAD(+) diphosphatase [Alphaproteobacteria bacterium TMED89]
MNSDDEQKQISPAHLDRDDPSPSAAPRRSQLGDQTPRAFADASRDLSGSRLPYTFEGLERDGLNRKDDAAIAAALNDPAAVIMPVWRRRVLMSADGEALLNWPKDRLTDRDTVVFLGLKDGTPFFAADISSQQNDDGEAPEVSGPSKGMFIDPWMTGPNLDPFRVGVGAYGRHLLAWHRSHRYCGRCGSETDLAKGGLERRCVSERCGEYLFPRINPATIMLVQDPSGEKCVMARNHNFPPTIHSVLAGYVDAGETLEQTVVREVEEEVGLSVKKVRYAASQPWAFSSSLMIGFFAWSADTDLTVNLEELERADWYTREEINDLRGSQDFRLPRKDSIARFLIETWLTSTPERLS